MPLWEQFDQIGKKISDVGQGLSQSTKNFSETSRLNNLVNEKKREISNLFSSMGQTYFEQHKSDPNAEMADLIAQVASLSKEIDAANQEIQKIKGIETCPNCGSEIAANASFCSKCGAKTVKKETVPAGMKRCPQCGAFIDYDSAFCTKCGSKIEESPIEADAIPSNMKKCPQCGALVENDNKFCNKCGRPFEKEIAVESTDNAAATSAEG